MEKCTSNEIMAGMEGRLGKVMEVSTPRSLHSYKMMSHADGRGMTLMTTNNNPDTFALRAPRLPIITQNTRPICISKRNGNHYGRRGIYGHYIALTAAFLQSSDECSDDIT
jgi:hypothetical protein